MRPFRPVVLRTLTATVLAVGVAPALPPVAAWAQSKAAAPADVTPKPVTLTQAHIDSAVATQKAIRAFEEKQPQDTGDKPDPKADAALEAIVKKNGFADMDTYANVSATIGVVMAGIDPETKTYVGPAAVIKKQIAEVQGDAKMPAKEKKEALDELNAALKTAPTDKPAQGNIDLVAKNFDALSQGMDAE